jgi:hypothetical protein
MLLFRISTDKSIKWGLWGSLSGNYEDYDLLYYDGNALTFRRNISPPSSVSKIKRSKKQTASFLLGLLFDIEDAGNKFLWNVTKLHGVTSQKMILFIKWRTYIYFILKKALKFQYLLFEVDEHFWRLYKKTPDGTTCSTLISMNKILVFVSGGFTYTLNELQIRASQSELPANTKGSHPGDNGNILLQSSDDNTRRRQTTSRQIKLTHTDAASWVRFWYSSVAVTRPIMASTCFYIFAYVKCIITINVTLFLVLILCKPTDCAFLDRVLKLNKKLWKQFMSSTFL